jgi:hypothetical protein
MIKLNSKIIELKPHKSQPNESHSTSGGWGRNPSTAKGKGFWPARSKALVGHGAKLQWTWSKIQEGSKL